MTSITFILTQIKVKFELFHKISRPLVTLDDLQNIFSL